MSVHRLYDHICIEIPEVSANMLDELNSLNVYSDELIYQDLEEEPNSQIWDKKDKFEKI